MCFETLFSNEQNDILNLLKHNPKHQVAKQPKDAVIAPQFAGKFNTGNPSHAYVYSHALKTDYRKRDVLSGFVLSPFDLSGATLD